MLLFEQVKSLLMAPETAWDRVALEPLGPIALTLRYILPLSLIAPLASYVGMTIFNSEWSHFFGYRVHGDRIAGAAASTFLFSVLSVYVIAAAFCMTALLARVPPDYRLALNIATIGAIPLWFSGVLLVMLPGALLCFAFAVHALWLYSLGAVRLLGVKPVDAVFFVVFSLLFLVIASFILGAMASHFGLH